MNFKSLLPVGSVLALLALAGCEDNLTEINRNPNAPEDVPVENILAGGLWDVVSNAADRGAFGAWTMLYHTELWAQHAAQSAYNDEDKYTPRDGIPDAIWTEMYAALIDLQRVQEVAAAEGDDNLWAVAEIMTVYGFHNLTDFFGDVPYFEALNLEEFQYPKYTPQSEIYEDLLARLATAAGMLDRDAEVTFERGDLIYGGDMDAWYRFANSLRLRLAMRLADTPLSGTASAAFADAWADGVIDDVATTAQLDWTGTQPSQNPIYEQIILGGRSGDFRISATTVDTLQALNDPRLPIFADPAASDGAYRGLPNGFLPAQLGLTVNDFSWIGEYFVEPGAPSVLMSRAEVLFLAAEGAARGWIAGSPEALYREGITASLQQYGISAAAINAYLAQPRVAYTGMSSIYLQKWIALFMAGPEAWAEVRRTGVPALALPNGAVEDRVPTRFPYPDDEAIYNQDNYPEGVEITDPIWWMGS